MSGEVRRYVYVALNRPEFTTIARKADNSTVVSIKD